MEVKINVSSKLMKHLFWPVWGVIKGYLAIVKSWRTDKELIWGTLFVVCLVYSVLVVFCLMFSLLAAGFDDAFFFLTRDLGPKSGYSHAYEINWFRWVLLLISGVFSSGLALYIDDEY